MHETACIETRKRWLGAYGLGLASWESRIYYLLSGHDCGNETVPLDHQSIRIDDDGVTRVFCFLNDSFEIGIGYPDRWHCILRREAVHKFIFWYLSKWIFGEWLGLRRWIWYKLLHRRCRRYQGAAFLTLACFTLLSAVSLMSQPPKRFTETVRFAHATAVVELHEYEGGILPILRSAHNGDSAQVIVFYKHTADIGGAKIPLLLSKTANCPLLPGVDCGCDLIPNLVPGDISWVRVKFFSSTGEVEIGREREAKR